MRRLEEPRCVRYSDDDPGQVERQHTWISGQFVGISNGITKFKTDAAGMTKVQNKIMTTMLGGAYEKLFFFVKQVCLLPGSKARLGRENQEVWTTLGAAERAFGDVEWELGHSSEALSDAAIGSMQEGDTVEIFMKRWHDFQLPLSGEADTAQKNADSMTYEQVAAEVRRETNGINGGFAEIQRIAGVFASRREKCTQLSLALRTIDQQMTQRYNGHSNMVQEYDDMYNKIIDDKNYAYDMWEAMKVLSGTALEIDNPLSTRDGALDYLITALKKEKARDQHGSTVVPEGVEKIFKHINEKLGRSLS